MRDRRVAQGPPGGQGAALSWHLNGDNRRPERETGGTKVITAPTAAATRMATVIMAGSRAWRLRLRLPVRAALMAVPGLGRDLDESDLLRCATLVSH